jgi:hypothetical protein
MLLTWNELTIPLDNVDMNSLLEWWRWLVDPSLEPQVMTALGDLFLRHPDGRIFRLDTGWGKLTEVAKDEDDFHRLRMQPQNAMTWFAPQIVGELLTRGLRLRRGECFGYRVPLVLGGEYTPDNFDSTYLEVHFGILGQIHFQVKDLPDGTPINSLTLKDLC